MGTRVNTGLLDWRIALERVLETCAPTEVVEASLDEAHGSIVARAIQAPRDVPLFPNSAMDGYAVVAESVATASAEHPVRLEIVGEARAGSAPVGRIRAGQAVEIMTGAPIPSGADAVVPVERTERLDPRTVAVLAPAVPGQAIRAAARDFRRGDLLVHAGEEISPGLMGLLAAAGIGKVPIHRRPSVAVAVTGDELVDPCSPNPSLAPGQIFDANSVMLTALLEEAGAALSFLGRVSDTQDGVRGVFEAVCDRYDLLVLSGGVSKGKYDFVRQCFSAQGGKELFWGVNQQPGKPLFVGKLGRTVVFGLPGNPVSAYFCADLYVRSAIARCRGALEPLPTEVSVAAAQDFLKSDERTAFRRVRLLRHDRQLFAASAGPADSDLIHTVARHHGYLVIPPERARIRAGDPATVVLPDLRRLAPEPLKTLLAGL